MPTNESRMDDELNREGAGVCALENWIARSDNQEIAESIVWGWQELRHSFDAEFPGCELADTMTIDEVAERFRVSRQR